MKTILLPQHLFTTSAKQALLTKETYFELPNLGHLRTLENNPHHWPITDILQMRHFQYQFFKNLTLNNQTIKQIRIYSLLLRKIFRHNY